MHDCGGGVVSVDAVGVARLGGESGPGTHLIDQPLSTGAVDAGQAQHCGGGKAGVQHALGVKHDRIGARFGVRGGLFVGSAPVVNVVNGRR